MRFAQKFGRHAVLVTYNCRFLRTRPSKEGMRFFLPLRIEEMFILVLRSIWEAKFAIGSSYVDVHDCKSAAASSEPPLVFRTGQACGCVLLRP